MTPFVKKEIRLLLPVWCSILALEIVTPWMFPWILESFNLSTVVFFLGLVILAVDSFGREFSLGTFQNLMSQPMERRAIWSIKIRLLGWGALLIFVAFFVSNYLRLQYEMFNPAYPWGPDAMLSDFFVAMGASAVLLVIAISGGLWTTLLFRQIAAAFWITLLLPILGLLLLSFFLPEKLGENQLLVNIIFVIFAGLYGWWGFRLARRLFFRAEDVAWTGGIVDFSRWRYFERANRSMTSHRRWRPFAALLKKELQLQSVSFICAGALLAIHLVVLGLREVHGPFQPGSTLEVITQNYWALWLIMPLLVGGTVIAEERKLNMTDVQFCLPISRRKQFALKLMITMALGVLFGGFMPFGLELVSAVLSGANNLFTPNDLNYQGIRDGLEALVCISAALSLLSIFASSLSRQFLQALTITFVAGIGLGIFGFILLVFLANWNNFQPKPLQRWSWQVALLVAIPVLVILFLGLAWRNYQLFHERKRRLWMNIISISGALVFIVLGTLTLYNRAWEYLEPAEPAHGPAELSPLNPPKMVAERNDLLSVRLPDGRLWLDRFGVVAVNEPQWMIKHGFITPRITSAGPNKFISESNWISDAVRYDEEYQHERSYYQITGYLDTVGIQSNGTLWVSVKSDNGRWSADQLTRFGDDSDWQQVVQSDSSSVILLKTNGTLWRWGTDRFDWRSHPLARNWPGLRTFQPFQLGANFDWVALGHYWGGSLARKADGSVWEVSHLDANGVEGLHRMTNYDRVPAEVSQFPSSLRKPYIREDGTLWFSYQDGMGKQESIQQLPISHETNWISTSWDGGAIFALRSDGTLWKWERLGYPAVFSKAPDKIGIHSDWVASTLLYGSLVTLAGDGSLWLWLNSDVNQYQNTELWIKYPRQPIFLGNVLTAEK